MSESATITDLRSSGDLSLRDGVSSSARHVGRLSRAGHP